MYYLFIDAPILLDMVTFSDMLDKELLDEKNQDSLGKFENETAANVVASFNRELPSIFGRIDSTSSSRHPVFTHLLLLIKLREYFNAPDNYSRVEQRIILELDHIVNSVSADIVSCLVGAPFSLILTQIFLLQSRSTVDSILTWMDKFYQELISTGVPSKDTWPLVRSCIRFF